MDKITLPKELALILKEYLTCPEITFDFLDQIEGEIYLKNTWLRRCKILFPKLEMKVKICHINYGNYSFHIKFDFIELLDYLYKLKFLSNNKFKEHKDFYLGNICADSTFRIVTDKHETMVEGPSEFTLAEITATQLHLKLEKLLLDEKHWIWLDTKDFPKEIGQILVRREIQNYRNSKLD